VVNPIRRKVVMDTGFSTQIWRIEKSVSVRVSIEKKEQECSQPHELGLAKSECESEL
jgi:hypothetical protein